MDAEMEPKLAPPGAGLPWLELQIARLLFAVQFRMGNRDSFNAAFQAEREKIRALVRSCDEESGARRVLIRRVPGLEDSSRYWSVWMTLEHLRIVHEGMTKTITALGKGIEPQGVASTAAVKPVTNVAVGASSLFERSCDTLLAAVAAVPDLNTKVRFAHPWFGPLNAAGWHALAGNHLAVHRVQIERILQGLRR